MPALTSAPRNASPCAKCRWGDAVQQNSACPRGLCAAPRECADAMVVRDHAEGQARRHALLHAVRRTKRNQVVRITREHYLRDDLENPLSSPDRFAGEPVAAPRAEGDAGDATGAQAHRFVVLDASCLPYQVDLLERGAAEGGLRGVVLLASVIAAVRRRRGDAARRRVLDLVGGEAKLNALGATAGASTGAAPFCVFRDDHCASTSIAAEPPVRGESRERAELRALTRACEWLVSDANAADAARPAVLWIVSDDPATRATIVGKCGPERMRRLLQSGYVRVLSTEQWIGAAHPILLDLVATSADADAAPADAAGGASGATFAPYPEHMPGEEMERRVRSGELRQGKLRCASRWSPWRGVVSVRSLGPAGAETSEVKILGRRAMNRAMEGDLVAIEAVPASEALAAMRAEDRRTRGARTPQAAAPGAGDGDGDGAEEAVGLATVAEETAIDDTPTVGDAAGAYGRVVGIVRRGWKDKGYVGAIQPRSMPASEHLRTNPGRPIGVLFQPADRRLPLIRMRTRQPAVLASQRIVCVIDAWDRTAPFPTGHYVRALGTCRENTRTRIRTRPRPPHSLCSLDFPILTLSPPHIRVM